MKQKLKALIQEVGVLSLAISTAFIIVMGFSIARGWVDAPANPPAGNVGAPINTSSVAQTKDGGLIVANGASVDPGLIVANGDVGIGMTNPDAKLDVDGTIKINDSRIGCDSTHEGSIKFDGTDFWGCVSGSWVSFTAGNIVTPGNQVFTSSGTFNVPTGVSTVYITAVGGGGGGAAGGNAAGCFGGAGYGGAAGQEVTRKLVLLGGATTVNVVVGTGGNGGHYTGGHACYNPPYSDATNGHTTRFGSFLTLQGGANGDRGVNSGSGTNNGGATTLFGKGGLGCAYQCAGASAKNTHYGAGGGGGGAFNHDVLSWVSGGDGADGWLKVEW